MGIKGWLTVGAGLVISAVYVIRRLQEENRREAERDRRDYGRGRTGFQGHGPGRESGRICGGNERTEA